MSCNGFNKCMLIAINVIFLILGAGLTAVGIWVITAKDSMFQFLNALTVSMDSGTISNYQSSTSVLLAAAYVAVAFGGLSVIVGFCGCCGAMRGNSCLLIFYSVAISGILLAEIAGAIAAGAFKNQIGNKLKPWLAKVEKDHFLPFNSSMGNSTSQDVTITAAVNYLQVLFQCCGASSQADITGNDTLWFRSNRMYNGRTEVVPVTCCQMKDNRGDLLSNQDWNKTGNYLVDPNCPNTGNNTINVGCYDELYNKLNMYSLPVIIVCASVGVLEIVCVFMAACMVQRIRSKGDGKAV